MAFTTEEETRLKKRVAQDKILEEIEAIEKKAASDIAAKKVEIEAIESQKNSDLQTKRDALSALDK